MLEYAYITSFGIKKFLLYLASSLLVPFNPGKYLAPLSIDTTYVQYVKEISGGHLSAPHKRIYQGQPIINGKNLSDEKALPMLHSFLSWTMQQWEKNSQTQKQEMRS